MTSFTQEMAARRERARARAQAQMAQEADALRHRVYEDAIEIVGSFMAELNADPDFRQTFGQAVMENTEDMPFGSRGDGDVEYISFAIRTQAYPHDEPSDDPDLMQMQFEIEINGRDASVQTFFSGYSFPAGGRVHSIQMESGTLDGLSGSMASTVMDGMDTVAAREASDAATPRM